MRNTALIIFFVVSLMIMRGCKGINLNNTNPQKLMVNGDTTVLSRWDDYLDFGDSANATIRLDYSSKWIHGRFLNALDEQVSNGNLNVGPYTLTADADREYQYDYWDIGVRSLFGTKISISSAGPISFTDSFNVPSDFSLSSNNYANLIDRNTGINLNWEAKDNPLGMVIDVIFNPIGDPYNAARFPNDTIVSHRSIVPDNGYHVVSGADFEAIPDSAMVYVSVYRVGYKPVRQNGHKIMLEAFTSSGMMMFKIVSN